MTDEILIDRINEAASVELERQNKQRKNMSSKIPKVSKLGTEVSKVRRVAEDRKKIQEQSVEVMMYKICKTAVVASSKDSELYKTVRLLRKEMTELRKSITNPRASPCHAQMSMRRGCKGCQEQGTGDDCEHCFKCGQSGHISIGCREQKG